jgi:hypothetical protein
MAVSGPAFATMEEEPRAEHFEEGSGIVVSRMNSIDELGEPSAEFQKADSDKDGNNVGYLSGGDAPTLFFAVTTPPLFDRENKRLTIISLDVEVTLKDGFGKTVLTNTLEINPYSETQAYGARNTSYTGYACFLLRGKVGSFEYDRYCLEETEVKISQKQYNYMVERFGSSSTAFRAEASLKKVWFSDGSTFDRRRGYSRPTAATTKGHSASEVVEDSEVKTSSQIKSIKDAFSFRTGVLKYEYLKGENYAYVMPAGVLNNLTGKRLTGIEARVTYYSPRGEVVFNRVLRSEVDEENRDSGRALVAQMYFDNITFVIFDAVKRAIEINIAEKMELKDYIKLIKFANKENYRVSVEPLGARFDDGTGMGTLRN